MLAFSGWLGLRRPCPRPSTRAIDLLTLPGFIIEFVGMSPVGTQTTVNPAAGKSVY
jgi:hypothetical protein